MIRTPKPDTDLIQYKDESGDIYYYVYCPECRKFVSGSSYLHQAFSKEKILWLANMITHFRHAHNKMYNELCRQHVVNFNKYYQKVKAELNEGVKRKLIMNHADFLIQHKITADVFAQLQETKARTLELCSSKVDELIKSRVQDHGAE